MLAAGGWSPDIEKYYPFWGRHARTIPTSLAKTVFVGLDAAAQLAEKHQDKDASAHVTCQAMLMLRTVFIQGAAGLQHLDPNSPAYRDHALFRHPEWAAWAATERARVLLDEQLFKQKNADLLIQLQQMREQQAVSETKHAEALQTQMADLKLSMISEFREMVSLVSNSSGGSRGATGAMLIDPAPVPAPAPVPGPAPLSAVPPLPPMPVSISNIGTFYSEWDSSMRGMYAEHKSKLGRLCWEKAYPKPLAQVMLKRYHVYHDALIYIDTASFVGEAASGSPSSAALGVFEDFVKQLQEAGVRMRMTLDTYVVKSVFYNLVRPDIDNVKAEVRQHCDELKALLLAAGLSAPVEKPKQDHSAKKRPASDDISSVDSE